MDEQKVITGYTEDEVWQIVEADLARESDILTYDAIINQGNHQIKLYIDIDLGGGFEGGSAITQLTSPLKVSLDFKFALHDEDFLDTIGKFFGLEDIVTGYPELDNHVVIKTNAREKLTLLFADEETRQIFTTLEDFDFGIRHHTVDDIETPFLEFNINDGITDPVDLRRIYRVFYKVLEGLEK